MVSGEDQDVLEQRDFVSVNNETRASNSPPVSQKIAQTKNGARMIGLILDESASPLKKKLTAIYENQSANGGDPTLSAKGGGSSKRSTKKSEVDFQLKAI